MRFLQFFRGTRERPLNARERERTRFFFTRLALGFDRSEKYGTRHKFFVFWKKKNTKTKELFSGLLLFLSFSAERSRCPDAAEEEGAEAEAVAEEEEV